VCFLPDWFWGESAGGGLFGEVKYVPVEIDRPVFERFLIQVSTLLEQPIAPPRSSVCVWCNWRDQSSRYTSAPGASVKGPLYPNGRSLRDGQN
jgi:hypothetical protein